MRHDHTPDQRCERCDDWPRYAIELAIHLQRLEDTVATQADIDALTAAVTADDSALLGAVTGIAAEIAALQSANPDLDLSGLQGKVTDLSSAVTSVQALVPAATTPAPAPEPTPVPVPAAVLPTYTFSGDPSTIDTTQWTAVPNTTPQQYTFAGDTAGSPATGDGLGGVWHLFTPTSPTV